MVQCAWSPSSAQPNYNEGQAKEGEHGAQLFGLRRRPPGHGHPQNSEIANPKNGTTNKAAGRLEMATRAADSWSAQMSRSPGRLSAWAIFKGENLKFP